MSSIDIRSAKRPDWDQELVDIADFVCNTEIDSDLAFETAHYCLMDTLACGFQALDYPACTKLLGTPWWRWRPSIPSGSG
jgi:2-methylcitrate dehydratase